MKILPKVYWLSVDFWKLDKKHNKYVKGTRGIQGFAVARSAENATKIIIKKTIVKARKQKYTIHVLEHNYFSTLAGFIIPKYWTNDTHGRWEKTR